MKDVLQFGDITLHSRLIIGSGKLENDGLIPTMIKESGAEAITVALRRVDLDHPDDDIMRHIPEGVHLMPNTSGARNAEEAVRIAELSRALGRGNWVKLEVISDARYLLPDGYETVKACEVLAEKGFQVFPYINPDLMVARSLYNAGAVSIMPLAAPIGTNRGLQTKEMIRIIIEEIPLPVIVDAGLGKPSQACETMEMGAAACMVNTAIATAGDPALMARAFADAIKAGRQAYLSGLGREKLEAEASSPLTGFLRD